MIELNAVHALICPCRRQQGMHTTVWDSWSHQAKVQKQAVDVNVQISPWKNITSLWHTVEPHKLIKDLYNCWCALPHEKSINKYIKTINKYINSLYGINSLDNWAKNGTNMRQSGVSSHLCPRCAWPPDFPGTEAAWLSLLGRPESSDMTKTNHD